MSPASDSTRSSGRESAAPLEVSYTTSDNSDTSGVGYQYDNARKRAIRMAQQGSGDPTIPEEAPQNGQSDAFARGRAPAQAYAALPPQMTPAQQPPAALPEQGRWANSGDVSGQNTGRRPVDTSTVFVEPDSGINWAAERKKDREERMLERTEREQERTQRRREMDERAQERQERKKERDERASEREEKRREREELLRLKSIPNGGSGGADYTASTQKIQELERANGVLAAELDALKGELRGVKEAMQAEQDKTNSLVQYMKLFQFPDERMINVNKLRNLIACAQQKVATIVNLKSANWWMALGPSQGTHDRIEKALALVGNRRVDGIASSLFQCEPAMAYVVEYHSRLESERNQDYTVFGCFSRDVYSQAWNALNKIGDERGRIEPVAFNALLNFVCSEERS